MSARFHLSFFVKDLESTREFYGRILGCPEGHVGTSAVDFSFFGNQLTCHVGPDHIVPADSSNLDGHHFGAVVPLDAFQRIAARLESERVPFIVRPHVQKQGTPDERWKMVFTDASGNAIELKSYKEEPRIFGERE